MPGAPPIVAVPARDEAERLPRLLASLAAQRGFGPGRRLAVLVLANNCRDGTARAVTDYAATETGAVLDLQVIPVELSAAEAHVGTARRLAMDAAADLAGPDGILLTTDSDAHLPPDWVSANLAALATAEIVGGRLIIDAAVPDPRLQAFHAAVERYWAAVRDVEDRLDPQPHDPAPRHGDHTGASLGLRVSTYRSVGGLPPLSYGEDNALVGRVVEAGGRLRHDPRVIVHVSDRAVGRVGGGMATEMARRQRVLVGTEAYLLPEPAQWRRLVKRRAALRAAWRRGRDAAAAALVRLDLPADAIEAISPASCPNDIAFVERTHRRLEQRQEPARLVPLAEALAGFEAA